MIEVFHSTGNNLGKVLKKGLKAPYQLDKEGIGDGMFTEASLREAKEITRFLCASVFFTEEKPIMDEWVSILLDECDSSIRVGNMNLVDAAYNPGPLYEKSLMTLGEYLERKNIRKSREVGVNPFTAEPLDWDEAEEFLHEWRDQLEEVLGCENVLEYESEILVPRLIIPPSEFHDTCLDEF